MSRSRIVIEFADRPAYSVRVGAGLAGALGSDVRALGAPPGRCLALCDSDSSARCLPALSDSLAGAGFAVADISIPAVEPERAWECIAELHRAFSTFALPAGSPIVVCACAEASELAAFAAATYGGAHPLVAVPASMAAAFRLLAVDDIELDAGHPVPIRVPARISHAVVDVGLLACESGEEADLGLYELAQAGKACDAGYARWQAENARAIAAYDADACVLALTQTLASRADAVGEQIASRIAG